MKTLASTLAGAAAILALAVPATGAGAPAPLARAGTAMPSFVAHDPLRGQHAFLVQLRGLRPSAAVVIELELERAAAARARTDWPVLVSRYLPGRSWLAIWLLR